MDLDRRFTASKMTDVKLERRDAAQGEPAPRPLITGYAAVFYRADDPGTQYELWPGFVERIDPRAFDRAIREDDVVGLFNHNPDHVLGRNKAGTLKLSVDERGLRFSIDPPETELARQVGVALERGDVSGSSFAFSIETEEFDRSGEITIRTIKSLRLYDVGPVTYPAYSATTAQLSERSSRLRDAAQRIPLSVRRRELELLARK